MEITLTEDFLGEEEEADLIEWVAADGSTVNIGDVICQFETSKLVTEFTAPVAGTLTQIAEEEDVVSLDEVFAKIS